MASNLGKVFIFAAGAAIGSLITYKVVKDKMEETIEQEVNEIREHYKTKLEETEEIHDDSEYFVYEEDEEVDENDKYEDMVSTKGYVNYSNTRSIRRSEMELADGPDEEEIVPEELPFIIPAEEYGEHPHYTQFSLYWYEDDVLLDDLNEPVEDYDEYIGDENLDPFRDSAHTSAIYIQNDKIQAYFEILRDGMKSTDYKDDYVHNSDPIREKKPHQL